MKQPHILTYIINSLMVLVFCVSVHAQNDSISNQNPKKDKYGLRLGADLSKLARTNFTNDYSGFEIVGDFRLRKNLYLAAEMGYDEKSTITNYLDIKTKGGYFKGGVDINLYQNWLDMDNMIYTGFRIGASTFSQNLNSYTIYNTNQYWPTQYTSNQVQEFNDLTAFWTELIVGVKVELVTNLYLGLNAQLKLMVNENEPNNFGNVYVPGFNKTYDSNGIGVGCAYSLSYRIPLYKKVK